MQTQSSPLRTKLHDPTPAEQEYNSAIRQMAELDVAIKKMIGTKVENEYSPTKLEDFPEHVVRFFWYPSPSEKGPLLEEREAMQRLRKSAGSFRKAIEEAKLNHGGLIDKIEAANDVRRPSPHLGLAPSNIVDLGGPVEFSLESVICLELRLSRMLSELELELEKFNKQGPPINVRAYEVAEILAEIYFNHCGEIPTFGMNGPVPSGAFTVALEEVFNILEVNVKTLRNPATAAIDKLKAKINSASGGC